jgi:gp16 family phage-associated protein
MRALRTREQARQWFEVSGLKVSDWAREHDLPAAVVYALLAGRTRGRYGDSHRAAVALRLKPDLSDLEGEISSPVDACTAQAEGGMP